MEERESCLDRAAQRVNEAMIDFKEELIDAHTEAEAERVKVLAEIFEAEFRRLMDHAATRAAYLRTVA